MSEIICSGEEDGLTALQLLCRRLPAAPVSYLRQLLRRGKVRRQEEVLTEQTTVAAGDQLRLPASGRLEALRTRGELTILHESRDLLVVEKPAGVAVHRGVGHETDNLTARVEELVHRRGEPYRVAPVHRLDAETSGPVLFAKGKRAAAALGQLFMDGAVTKEYIALVDAGLPATGELTTPVPAKGKMKASRTDWQTLAVAGDYCLLQLRLHSGRTHQIRRQLAAAGHPVVGDRRYGGPVLPQLDRLFLHASRLALVSPFDSQPVEFASALPTELTAVLRRLFPELGNLP